MSRTGITEEWGPRTTGVRSEDGQPSLAVFSSLSPLGATATAVPNPTLQLLLMVNVLETFTLRPSPREQRVLRLHHLKDLLATCDALKTSFHPLQPSRLLKPLPPCFPSAPTNRKGLPRQPSWAGVQARCWVKTGQYSNGNGIQNPLGYFHKRAILSHLRDSNG